ncbi:hypothetical protein bpr_I0399 [Butyrivibrio proteoclasticus B316]|uniref:Methyltransferase FkbM domain-containing protein n=1 Tax=Butyrivibrio proteoclasticus (strain ATCC 51982 / DSM 14932 / B316) TaxID=515622 RepID=E0RZF0_BUTPB|nr:FkbM family methyltransferase [Butyrivibrio proteoclasticus]ADL33147.1 hypothetical protein bpr_I0399 [Butyrivibrio proteoclasticus B316]
MYEFIVSIFSIFPESVFDFFIGFCSQIKYRGFLKRIKSELCTSDVPEYRELGESISVKHYFFPYNDEIGKKIRRGAEIEVDSNNGHKVVKYKNFCLYFPGEWTKTKCKSYMRSLLVEQDKNSSHAYFTDELEKIDNYGTVIDLGAAEGIFTADVIDKAEKVYLFEYNDSYIECLNRTFEKYKDKVEIVKKYVSDKNQGEEISLDGFFGDEIPDNIGLIKMDIEGAEQSALRGMKKVLERNPNAILLVCVYHSQDAEEEIKSILDGYEFNVRKGYRLVPSMGEQKYPYFRHGVLEAHRTGLNS